jgi:uncharacterized membrane protein
MLPDNIKIFLLRILISPALFGVIFMIVGLLASKFPPKAVNMYYGYRTRRSMLNQDTWMEANRYAPILMTRLGLGCLLLGIGFGFFIGNLTVHLFLMAGITLIAVILILVLTEKRLNTLFDKAGNRRSMPSPSS